MHLTTILQQTIPRQLHLILQNFFACSWGSDIEKAEHFLGWLASDFPQCKQTALEKQGVEVFVEADMHVIVFNANARAVEIGQLCKGRSNEFLFWENRRP